MQRGWSAVAVVALAAAATPARAQPPGGGVPGAVQTPAAIDDSPALPTGSPQAFVGEFLRDLSEDATEAVLEYIAPGLLDEFLRANGTVVKPANRRIVVRNVLAGARGLVAVSRYAVAPEPIGTTHAGDSVVRVELRSSIEVTRGDVERRKRAAADPELVWALGPATARLVVGMTPEERDAYFDRQLGTTLESSAPIHVIVKGTSNAGYRIDDIIFGGLDGSGLSLRRLPELVNTTRGGEGEIQRKRSLASVRAIMFAVGALIILLSLRRFRQQQAEKRREKRLRWLRRRRKRRDESSPGQSRED